MIMSRSYWITFFDDADKELESVHVYGWEGTQGLQVDGRESSPLSLEAIQRNMGKQSKWERARQQVDIKELPSGSGET